MGNMTDFWNAVSERQKKYPAERYGQRLYNALYELNPQLALSVCSTDADPFYSAQDELKITIFLRFVEENTE